ncbi:hypothetical protein [Actinomadura rubrisoli]|uniref:DivIVA domain-containing protein n=1 Tax=Actinomadura rubrisoli TaxID=2530368 RepID=A0A4R5CA42_9ACTN|nr:hypothetical protein [Actinomadura rubrisoli]TDD95649.1 hypothetical protein E1298_04540 [Actinomadura rubrisoli]
MIVVVVLVLAGAAVLGAVVVLAMGRGGGLAETHPDYPPLPSSDGGMAAGPAAGFPHLPRGMWGYQVTVTDEALRGLAHALSERDARLASLEQQVDDLRHRLGGHEQVGALHGIQEQTAGNGPLPSLQRETPEDAADEPVGGGAEDRP